MSQLSLPIQEFYQALSDGDRQYAQEQAQEIKLIARNAASQIGLKLIKVKERLGYGQFGDWIKLEFEWTHFHANRLMTIASELGDYTDQCNLPIGTNPAYALASAMSKEDEDGKQEILNAYQDSLAEKQEKAKADGEKIPNALTEKEIKELREKLRQKDGEINQLKQVNQFVSSELQKQQDLLIGIESTLQDSAKSLAQTMVETEVKKATQDLRNELTQLKAEKQRLENAQTLAESQLKDAKEKHAKALADFKANPDSDTKKAINDAKKTLDDLLSDRASLTTEVLAIRRRIEDTIGLEEHRANATRNVMSFFKKIEEVFQHHHKHILSFSSLNLDDAYVAKAEDLIESIEEYIAKLKKALADRQFNQATQVQAVEVEIVQDDENLEDF